MQLGGLEQCEPGALSVFKEHTTTRDQLEQSKLKFLAQGNNTAKCMLGH